ncbi:hypothetical protein, partial [Pseudomonas cannabina]|uniref:hypothetical protein n=1 Tax=Pseudomonas cannabina TaxID=86840 RepID=UPI001C7EDE09
LQWRVAAKGWHQTLTCSDSGFYGFNRLHPFNWKARAVPHQEQSLCRDCNDFVIYRLDSSGSGLCAACQLLTRPKDSAECLAGLFI